MLIGDVAIQFPAPAFMIAGKPSHVICVQVPVVVHPVTVQVAVKVPV